MVIWWACRVLVKWDTFKKLSATPELEASNSSDSFDLFSCTRFNIEVLNFWWQFLMPTSLIDQVAFQAQSGLLYAKVNVIWKTIKFSKCFHIILKCSIHFCAVVRTSQVFRTFLLADYAQLPVYFRHFCYFSSLLSDQDIASCSQSMTSVWPCLEFSYWTVYLNYTLRLSRGLGLRVTIRDSYSTVERWGGGGCV